MNRINIFGRLQNVFNADEKKKKKKTNDIVEVIDKLHVKMRKINAMLDECENEEIKKALQLEANIISAQIQKGLSILENH